MEYFHFTLPEFLSDILAVGLRINSGHEGAGRNKVDFYKTHFGMQPIFLTTNPDRTIETMLGSSARRYVLLKVDPPSVIEERYPKLFDCEPPWDGFSYVCLQDIKRVKLIR